MHGQNHFKRLLLFVAVYEEMIGNVVMLIIEVSYCVLV